MDDSEIAAKRELFMKINSKIKSTALELLCFWPIVLVFFILISLRLDNRFESAWSYLFILVWWILALAVLKVAIYYYIRWEIKKNNELQGYYSHSVFTTIFELFYSQNDGSSPEITLALIGIVFFSILLPLRLDGIEFPWTVAIALPGLPSAITAIVIRSLITTRYHILEFCFTVFTAVIVEVSLLLIGLKLDGIITASWWLVNIPLFAVDILLPVLMAAPYFKDCFAPVFLLSIVWFSPLIIFHFFVVLKVTGDWTAGTWAVTFIPLHVMWVLLFISFWAFVVAVGMSAK